VAHVEPCSSRPTATSSPRGLCEQSFADYVFFCNSGAEAMECVIKGDAQSITPPRAIPSAIASITFEGAFHGRTAGDFGAATGSAKYLEGLRARRWTASTRWPHGDLEAVKKAIGPHTAGYPDRAGAGARAASARRRTPFLQELCANCATSRACCWRSTRCRPAWAAPGRSVCL